MSHPDLQQQIAEEQAGLAEAIVDLLTDLRELGLFATGAELVRSPGRTMRVRSSVDTFPQSTSTIDLLATNARRKGAAIYNDSQATLYLKLGPNCSTSDWTVALTSSLPYYELPAGYRGPVTAVFSGSGNGQARVTEYGW